MFKKIINKFSVLNNDDKKNIELIRNSNLFDEKYYLNDNPGVTMDAAKHYYYYGFKEGRSPSFQFSNDYYLETYKDINEVGINPLVHYLKYGKQENRIIKKDNGISLSELYYKKTRYLYSFNIYLTNKETKRINLFIDNDLNDIVDLINYILKYIKSYDYQLRIIYNDSLNRFRELLNSNNIKLPDKVEFLYLKENNFLFLGHDEKLITNSYQAALALLRTKCIKQNIYYYLNDNINSLEEQYYIDQVTNNPNVIILSNKKINTIDSFSLNIIVNGKLKNKIYYHSNRMFMLGIEWLNNIFMDEILDNNKHLVTVLNNNIKFHFDSDVYVFNDKNINIEKSKAIFELYSNIHKNPVVICNLEPTVHKIKSYDISGNDLSFLNIHNKFIKYYNKDYKSFEVTIRNCGDRDV